MTLPNNPSELERLLSDPETAEKTQKELKMIEDIEIVNAIINDWSVSTADHGVLTMTIFLEYGNGTSQGFGGYALCNTSRSFDCAGQFIWGIMDAAGVTELKRIQGKAIRVKREAGWNGKILKIGHITNDKMWFDPASLK